MNPHNAYIHTSSAGPGSGSKVTNCADNASSEVFFLDTLTPRTCNPVTIQKCCHHSDSSHLDITTSAKVFLVTGGGSGVRGDGPQGDGDHLHPLDA